MMNINAWIQILIVICSPMLSVNVWADTVKKTSLPISPESGVLAVIDGKPITLNNFRAEMERRRGVFNAQRKEELLNSILRSELLFAAAKSAGYENDPEIIDTIKQAMVGKYLRDNLDPKCSQLKASDQEIESYYQSHQAEFGTRAMIHIALIKISVSPKHTSEKKAEMQKRAESARAEALALEKGVMAFGSIAVKYSEDQDSRYRGGDIGWLQVGATDGRWDRKVTEAISALTTPGQISPVIAAPDGYYIVKLIEAKGATVKPFAAVKDGVRHQVIQEKKKKIESEFIEQLKNRIPVTVNNGLLDSISLPTEVKQAGPPALPVR